MLVSKVIKRLAAEIIRVKIKKAKSSTLGNLIAKSQTSESLSL